MIGLRSAKGLLETKGEGRMEKRRIGILTGGGDCAGLNPAIKWVVKTALDDRLQRARKVQYEIIGIRDGWKGLVEPEGGKDNSGSRVVPLSEEMVRTWDRYGGTNLGTSRTNPYDPKNNRAKVVLQNIERLGLDFIVAIGGEDTLGVAHKLSLEGVNVVGIPKTIDKDLSGTDYTLGFETAMNVITEEIDRLRTTAGSHRRIFVVETMGRHAGWLALEGGESSGAYLILIPEYDFEIDKSMNSFRKDGEKGPATISSWWPKAQKREEFLRSPRMMSWIVSATRRWGALESFWPRRLLRRQRSKRAALP
jgi:ATP-dependent phosphofructokinase / diphosphate-dependent phosphofructokinase